MPDHPISRAEGTENVLVGYANTGTVYVKDENGAALDLTGVLLTAAVKDEYGNALAPATVEVADAALGALAYTIAEADADALEGRRALLAIRPDLGAGVVVEGQWPIYGARGVAEPYEEGRTYVLPDLSLVVAAGEGVDVQAEWLTVRTLAGGGGGLWGGIMGTITDQADLVAYVAAQVEASEDNVAVVSETAATITLDIDAGLIAEETAATLTLDL